MKRNCGLETASARARRLVHEIRTVLDTGVSSAGGYFPESERMYEAEKILKRALQEAEGSAYVNN